MTFDIRSARERLETQILALEKELTPLLTAYEYTQPGLPGKSDWSLCSRLGRLQLRWYEDRPCGASKETYISKDDGQISKFTVNELSILANLMMAALAHLEQRAMQDALGDKADKIEALLKRRGH